MSDRDRIDAALGRLEFARQYGGQFYGSLTDDEWFWTPPGYATHVAWQVAHIAVSEYGLCIRRVRGRTAEDESLVPEAYIAQFGVGSTPVADRDAYPSRSEIDELLAAVRRETVAVLSAHSDAQLDVPVEQPHPVFKTKFGAVDYASHHEFLHIGQIGMLRRLMGKPAIR